MKKPAIEQSVEFQARNGKTLRGVLHLPVYAAARTAPAVVLFHGFTGNRMESHWMFVKCSRALARAGIASLRFDFYGSGESDGEFRQMTLTGEIADGRAAVAFMRKQKGIDRDRLGLLGLSLGGAVAATLAPGIDAKAIVLWSAVAHTARMGDLIKKRLRRIPNKPGAFEYDARELHPRLMEDVLKVEPIRHIVRYKGPTLVIHPENDETVPLSHAKAFFQAAGSDTKGIAIIAGADHVFTSVPWEHEVIFRTTQWFGHHL